MSDKDNRRSYRGIAGAILIISLGLVLLLGNAGMVEINLLDLLPYWPAILIVIGLDLMLGRSILANLIMSAVAVAAIAGLVMIASGGDPFDLNEKTTTDFSPRLQGATALEVTLDAGAADLTMGAGSGEYAAEGVFTTTMNGRFEPQYTVRADGVGQVRFTPTDEAPSPLHRGLVGELAVNLPPEVPIALALNMGAAGADLDLSMLTLTALEVNGGVSGVMLNLPPGDYAVDINLGIGALDIILPPEAAVQVHMDGLTIPTINASLTRGDDQVWRTDGYQAADDQIRIKIAAGPSAVSIEN